MHGSDGARLQSGLLDSMSEVSVREALSEAIRYWEPRRVLFNVVLILEVAVIFCLNLPGSRHHLNVDVALVLFVLAVLANVAYFASYVVDIAAQLSAFRSNWLRLRWVLLLIGLAFAGALTYFLSSGLFAPHQF
jgi:hypothetical protein